MASSVATPLERQFGRIASVTEMTSASTLGSSSITIQFDLNRNIDGAARDVQRAINAARAYLPSDLPANPTWRKVNPADAPIMILALTSAGYDRGALYDAASTILMQRLSQIPGVGPGRGGRRRAARRARGGQPHSIERIRSGPAGYRDIVEQSECKFGERTIVRRQTTTDIAANDQLLKAEDYRPLILGVIPMAIAIQLGDVADVEDSVENLRAGGFADGKPSVLAIIFKQPQANIIDTVDHVRQELPSLKASIPAGIDFKVMLDRTTTIRASVRDVERTLLISVGLVIPGGISIPPQREATLIPAWRCPCR